MRVAAAKAVAPRVLRLAATAMIRPVNFGARICGSRPCIKPLRSTVRHDLHLPPRMSAKRVHGMVSAHGPKPSQTYLNEPFGAVAEMLGTWCELVEDPPRIAGPSTPGKR
jgi:hypothetical protein